MDNNDNINQNNNHNNNFRGNQSQNERRNEIIRVVQSENDRIGDNHNNYRRQNLNNRENTFDDIFNQNSNFIWNFNVCKFFYFFLIIIFVGLSTLAVGIKENNCFFCLIGIINLFIFIYY